MIIMCVNIDSSFSFNRTIKITGEGKASQSIQTDVDGRGCIYLTSGSYSASVKLSQAADEAGMR